MASAPESILRDWSLADSIEKQTWTRQSTSFVEVKDLTVHKLRDQLFKVEKELHLKGKQQKNLESVRDQLETEINDLTANLFENANKMVVDANVKRMNAEKELEEAHEKISNLQADILAVKTLISSNEKGDSPKPTVGSSPSVKKKFSFSRKKTFTRSKSQQYLPATASVLDNDVSPSPSAPRQQERLENVDELEAFKQWKTTPELTRDAPFIGRLIKDDVEPCFTFIDPQLRDELVGDIVGNRLSIEPLTGDQHMQYCKLIGREVKCSHVTFTSGDPLYITKEMRDKMIAACELFLYLSYVKQGLVSSSNDGELFEQIQLLRRKIVLQRLGFSID